MLPGNKHAATPAAPGSGELIELGTALPDAATLNRIVTFYNARLSTIPGLPPDLRARAPLLFEPFCRAVADQESDDRHTLTWQAEETSQGRVYALGDDRPDYGRFRRVGFRPDETPDLTGYLAYLRRVMELDKLLVKHPQLRPVAAFPEAGRRMHTLVVAATGHGKSEVLKAMLHHYAERPRAGVLLIDPGRTLAVDVARWPELHRDNRVIYVEPELRDGLTVGFNPFDRAHLLDDREKSHLAETIGMAISEMTANLTDNMENLVINCARVLLDEPDATMEDLGRMVAQPGPIKPGGFIDGRRERLLLAGRSHPDRHVRNFFRFRFEAGSYAINRDYLGNRVDRITSMVDVRNALFGPSTIDLERELDAGKFVVVNLAKYGRRKQRAALGRLLVTMAAGIAARRMQREGPYMPVHLVVDEVTAMTSPQMIEVLNEARKVGVHATFAQQTEGEGFTKEQAAALVSQTGCRLAALGDPKRGAELLAYRGKADELPPLERGQFWVTWAGVPGVHTVQVRSDLVVRDPEGNVRDDVSPERWLPEAAWQAYVAWLTGPGGYYRRADVELPDEAEAVPPPQDLAMPARPTPARPERPAERPDASTPTVPDKPKPVSGRTKTVPAYEAVPAKTQATKPRKPTAGKPKPASGVRKDDKAPD